MSPPNSEIVADSEVIRGSADYHPSIWGDYFLSYVSNDRFQLRATDDMMRHQKLKQEVRSLLLKCATVPQTLEMIDSIQRLGVHYHFQSEIDEIIRNIIMEKNKLCGDTDSRDLYAVALEFRLARQHGYNISCDVLDKFKDKNGEFKESIATDARGLLSLYEATHLRTRGEESLDTALAFTVARLRKMATQLRSPLADEINHTLKQPFHKGLPRLEARHFLHFYDKNDSCSNVLLEFAKLDFNLLQKQHQIELSELTRWWKDLDFANKLPFARDRMVECYFWILGVHFEADYFVSRRILTKVIAITSVLDDIYDVFGTPQELEPFTAAFDRWDGSIDQLPDYMKQVYKAIVDIYTEIEEHLDNQGNSYRLYYAKEAMKKQVRAYYEESKWFHRQHIPTMDEHMSVALVSSGYPLLVTISLVLMDDFVTKDTFKWLYSEPKIVTASATIARLMDDIVSHKFEQERGHAASSVECYMKQYSCTEEEAVKEFKDRVENAWKDINGELMHPTGAPMAVLMRILNYARVMDVLYKNEDCYTNAAGALRGFVSSLLVHPVPI